LPVEFAALAAIEEVDDEPDGDPDEEADPCHDLKPGHEEQAEDDAEDGEYWAEGDAEAALAVGFLVAKDEDAGGDEDEGEEGADVGEVGYGSDVEETGGDGDEEAGDPGGDGGCPVALVDPGKDGGQQAVAGHGEPDACLSDLEDEDGGDHAEDGSDEHDQMDIAEQEAVPSLSEVPEGVDDGGGVIGHGIPVAEADEDDGNADVEDGADDECGDDADGEVALRIFTLFGGGGDGVKTDVGEEDDGAAGEDAGPSVGGEGVVVAGMDELRAGENEDEDGPDFEQDHDVVGAGGFLDAVDEDDGDDKDDDEGGDVEAEMPSGLIENFAGKIGESAGEIGRRDPFEGRMDAKPVHEVDGVLGKADGYGHVREGVFEDEAPSVDPGDELAERGVGVGIGGAGDGDHGGQLGVAEASAGADDGDEDERESERGPGAGAAGHGVVADEEVEQGGVEDRGGGEVLSADGGSDDGEDAGADDGANAEGDERDGAEGLAEPALRLLGLSDELIDGLSGEELRQSVTPEWG